MIHQAFKRTFRVAVASVLGLAVVAQAEVAVDLSSPKAALTTMAKGMQEGDKKAVRAAVTGDEKQMQAVDMMVDLVAATQKMQAAAKAKFGEIPDDQSQEIAKLPGKIEKAEVQIDGDNATVTMPLDQREIDGAPVPPAPGEKGEQIRLKKVGNDWKIDVAELSRGQELSEQQMNAGKTMIQAAHELAQEINDGKYQTYQEAMQAYQARMFAAIMQAMPQEAMPQEPVPPQEQPATQPSQP